MHDMIRNVAMLIVPLVLDTNTYFRSLGLHTSTTAAYIHCTAQKSDEVRFAQFVN